jgi:hypothetical protein
MGQKFTFIVIAVAVAMGFGAGFLVFRHSGPGPLLESPKPVAGPAAPVTNSSVSTGAATAVEAETWPPKKPEPEFGPDGNPTDEYRKKFSAYLAKVAGPHVPSEKEIQDAQVLMYTEQLKLEQMDPPNTILVRTKGKKAYVEQSLSVLRESLIRSGMPPEKLSPDLCKAEARASMQRKLKEPLTDTGRQIVRNEALKLGFPELAAERGADARAELDTLIKSLKSTTTDPEILMRKLSPYAPFTEEERTRIEAVAADPAATIELRGALLAELTRESGTSSTIYKSFFSTASPQQIVELINRSAAANDQVRHEMLDWISRNVTLESVKALQALSMTPDTEATARAIFEDKKRDVNIRVAAISALIGAHTPETNASLLKLWSNRDEDPRVRVAALRDEDPSHRDKLHALILDKTENASVRAAALQAVGIFSYERAAIADLEPAADDSPEIAAVWEKVSAVVDKLEDRRKH